MLDVDIDEIFSSETLPFYVDDEAILQSSYLALNMLTASIAQHEWNHSRYEVKVALTHTHSASKRLFRLLANEYDGVGKYEPFHGSLDNMMAIYKGINNIHRHLSGLSLFDNNMKLRDIVHSLQHAGDWIKKEIDKGSSIN